MTSSAKTISALVPWYGSNRSLRLAVGKELRGCRFVAVSFAGGMCEVPEIAAASILVNDKHRHVINLARVLRRDVAAVMMRLNDHIFDPDTLAEAQRVCKRHEPDTCPGLFGGSEQIMEPSWPERVQWAAAYFYATWCARNGVAGTSTEFDANLCVRYDDGGGDPVTRYRSAIAALPRLSEAFARCGFTVGCGIELCDRIVRSRIKAGADSTSSAAIYCDSPFPIVGDSYKHTFKDKQHAQLAGVLNQAPPRTCRVVCRFYDHPWVRELYPETRWTWRYLQGGKTQANEKAPEVLLINGPSYAGDNA